MSYCPICDGNHDTDLPCHKLTKQILKDAGIREKRKKPRGDFKNRAQKANNDLLSKDEVKGKMRKNALNLLLISTVLIAAVLYLVTGSYYVLILALGIVSFILVVKRSPTPKHKTFSDNDRLEATSRALGGGGFAKLWNPSIPGAKRRKQKRK